MGVTGSTYWGAAPLALYFVTRLTRVFCGIGAEAPAEERVRSRFSVAFCPHDGFGPGREGMYRMSIAEYLLIAVSMSMDAFAVAVCKGLSVRKVTLRHALITGGWFGGFQGLMPALGFALASLFAALITSVSHWIAFALLVLIGGSMIRESCDCEAEDVDDSFAWRAMLPLAVATSIDALAMGVTLKLQSADIFLAAPLIAVTTAILSALGLKVGNTFGLRYKSRAELAGGVVLVCLGVKILLEGLGVL